MKDVSVGGLDVKLAVEGGMGVAQLDQFGEAFDDGTVECLSQFVSGVVVSVDRSAVADPFDRGAVVLAGEQADVVDLRDAAGEQLDRAGGEVAVVVAVERRVVGAVQLMHVELGGVVG